MSRAALSRIALLALICGSRFLWIKLADRDFPLMRLRARPAAEGD